MTLTSICPECQAQCAPEDIESWAEYETVPVHCWSCGTVFWVAVEREDVVVGGGAKTEVIIDSFECGSKIIIDNNHHNSLHGSVGTIVELRRAHYLVAIGERRITIPKQWAKLWSTN